MKKRILAFAMAAVLVVGSAMSAFAETASSVSGTDLTDLGTNSGYETLTGDFDVTYTGHEVGGAFSAAPIVELRDGSNNCIDFRFDNWGWTWDGVNSVYTAFADNADVTVAITLWPSDVEDGWAGIEAQRQAGMDFEANIVRTGDTFYATFTEYLSDGTAYVTWTYTVPFSNMEDTLTATLSYGTNGGLVATELTNIVFTNNEGFMMSTDTVTTVVGSTASLPTLTYYPTTVAGTGTVTYSVASGADYITLDEENGTVTGVAAGTALVEITWTSINGTIVTGVVTVNVVEVSVTDEDGNVVTSTVTMDEDEIAAVITQDQVEELVATSTDADSYDYSVYAIVNVEADGLSTIKITGFEDVDVYAVLHLPDGATTWQVEKFTQGEDGVITVTGLTTLSPFAIVVRTASTTTDPQTTTADPQTTTTQTATTAATASATDAPTTAKTSENTSDTFAWSYVILLAGAAAAAVVIARKKVTE